MSESFLLVCQIKPFGERKYIDIDNDEDIEKTSSSNDAKYYLQLAIEKYSSIGDVRIIKRRNK